MFTARISKGLCATKHLSALLCPELPLAEADCMPTMPTQFLTLLRWVEDVLKYKVAATAAADAIAGVAMKRLLCIVLRFKK